MSNRTKAEFRNFDGWVRYKLSKNPKIEKVRTREGVDDELWCFLEYYSEIKEVGINFIKEKGIKRYPTYEKAFYMFQGFIRQARNYYNAAKALHYRSSSLLYYYSFLNLVKAYLILNTPDKIIGKKIFHGLSFIKDNLKFSKQRIKVSRNGVFPIFHKSDTGNSLPNNTTLNIVNLFSYCHEIGYQYQSGKFGLSKIIPCYCALAINNALKNSWTIVAIQFFDRIIPYKSIIKCFEEYFEEIDFSKDISGEIFQIQGWNHGKYRYYQSKNPKPLKPDGKSFQIEIPEELKLALNKVFNGNYYPDDYDFVISLPYLPNKQLQMNEPLAIYSIMFYLGSLVRYKPEYLEKLLQTKPAWLIESFVRTCPLTFLQIIISKIVGIDYILETI